MNIKSKVYHLIEIDTLIDFEYSRGVYSSLAKAEVEKAKLEAEHLHQVDVTNKQYTKCIDCEMNLTDVEKSKRDCWASEDNDGECDNSLFTYIIEKIDTLE